MKQLLQSLKDGTTQLSDVPAPKASIGYNLIKTSSSLVSAGTERMLVEFGKGNFIQKARSQPDKVRLVIDKVKTDGLLATVDSVKSKLDQPIALGYCNVGTVIEAKASGFSEGDRVVSNGKHAEIVTVPKNLCAVIPSNVSDEEASFTVLASIGLQGIRLANLTLGESVVVTGLGLIGLLTVQLLKAQGCRVLGIDFDPEKLKLARNFGAETFNPQSGEDIIARSEAFSRGVGVDAVIITATTSSNEPVSQAAAMCRKRGRIVLVGVVGLELNRADFYEKEITFQVSCSYGPGRYDSHYEDKGNDYPIGYVRWTEQRNFEAVLDMMADGALNLKPLITHRFDIKDGQKAMDLLTSPEPSLGIILKYGDTTKIEEPTRKIDLASNFPKQYNSKNFGAIAFLGAGNYAGRVLIPAFKAAGAQLHSIVTSHGVSAVHFGKKYGFKEASTESSSVFANESIDSVVIATRHDSHGQYVLEALSAGKHIFCEKPLSLVLKELAVIQSEARERPDQHLMIGFNRRFAPQIVKLKQLIQPISEPKSIIITVNAGMIPDDHWTHDHAIGGGRIVGEACHFIDLARHLTGSPIISHQVQAIGKSSGMFILEDKATINLAFEDGSFASIHYLANGHKGYPKERVEVFTSGRILQLENFKKLRGWGWSNFKSMSILRQDKGQKKCAEEFMKAVQENLPCPIDKEEIFEVSRVSIEVAEDLRG